MSMRGATAIVGFYEIPTRRTYPGRTMNGLLAEAAREAMKDAQIVKEDIDGLVVEGGDIWPTEVGEYMGLSPNFITGVSTMGASGGTAVSVAAMAVYSGLAKNVLVTIAAPREAGVAYLGGEGLPPGMRTEFENPFGPAVAANTGYGLMYSRHMHEYGTTQEQLAHIAANQRFNALENENAVFQGQPITVQDVLDSRYINAPLRLLESVMPCAGGGACIITSADRAKSFPNKPVYILGVGIASDPLAGWQRERMTKSAVTRSAPIAFNMSGYGPKDVQFAEFYD
jgi:acetyl-CoA acetyltransferase